MSWIHLEDTKPKARKPYRCFLCGGPIAVGETHIKRAGISENGPESTRMHIPCESLTRDWDQGDWESCDTATFRDEVLRQEKGGDS